jgi:hypothetical protein
MTHVATSRTANWMPLVSHKRSQNAEVFTLEDDGITLVSDLTAVVDGLMKISFTVSSNYSLAIESIALWYRQHLGISSRGVK